MRHDPYCCYCGEFLADCGDPENPVCDPDRPHLIFCSETCYMEDVSERLDSMNLSHIPPDYND